MAKRDTEYEAIMLLRQGTIQCHRGCGGAGLIPGILVEPLREWRNWQTRKT